jgi:alpha-beta hydrolase superfamily lysophospholipase
MQHSTGQFLARGGTTIFTQTWQPPDPRALVVLAHGFAEHSGRYDHVAQALTDAGYAVAALDHRGHGRSGGPRALLRDISELSADLALFRQELDAVHGDLPQVLLGHSMGGAVVLDHLLGQHDDVAAVVLSGPYIRNAAPVSPVLKRLAPVVGRIVPGVPTQKLPASAVSRDPAVVADYEADPLNYRGGVPAATAAALLAVEQRILADAHRISEPILIVHGTDDQLADVAGSRALAGRLGSSTVELKTYDGLYHEVFNEPERDTVLADVTSWLQERV